MVFGSLGLAKLANFPAFVANLGVVKRVAPHLIGDTQVEQAVRVGVYVLTANLYQGDRRKLSVCFVNSLSVIVSSGSNNVGRRVARDDIVDHIDKGLFGKI